MKCLSLYTVFAGTLTDVQVIPKPVKNNDQSAMKHPSSFRRRDIITAQDVDQSLTGGLLLEK